MGLMDVFAEASAEANEQNFYSKPESNVKEEHECPESKNEQKKKQPINPLLILFLIALLFIALPLSGMYYSFSKENKRLELIADEIEILVLEKNYEAALIKAQRLQFKKDDKNLKQQWNTQREETIRYIQELQKKHDDQ